MRRALLPLLGLLAACGPPDSTGHVCTALYALITTTVLDQSNTPLTGLTIRDSVLRTGATVTLTQEPLIAGGTYIIFDDGRQSMIRHSGDDVRVSGLRDGTPVFGATYRFDVPEGCHVHKVSGPDTVRVP